VAIRRSTAPQTAALIEDLAGADAVRREAAVARLAIAGVRAVEPLLRALPHATATGQAAILRALELIAAPRALHAAVTLLASPDTAVVIAAIGAVRSHLQSTDTDAAATALETLTAQALDVSKADAIRVAALGALSDLDETVLAALRERLRSEASPRVRRAAGLDGPVEAEVELAAARIEAAIETGESDPDLMRRLLIEAGGHVALSTLHDLVLYLRDRERATEDRRARGAWEAARGAAHLALGQRGSRLALFDLREALVQVAPSRLEDFAKAAHTVGDASCLEGLAIAWSRADEDVRDVVGQAFRAVITREGLTRRHAAVKRVLSRVPESASLLP
jgi:hypothetical protein